MSNNTFYSTIAPNSVKTMKILEEVKTSEGFKSFLLEKEVCFIRESESIIQVLYNDKVLIENASSRYNDYYGFLESVKNAVTEAKKFEKEYKLTKDSPLEIRVITTVTEIPCLQVDVPKNENKVNKQYLSIPENWLVHNSKVESLLNELNTINSKDTDKWYPCREKINKFKLKSKIVINDKVTYSSKKDESFTTQQKNSLTK